MKRPSKRSVRRLPSDVTLATPDEPLDTTAGVVSAGRARMTAPCALADKATRDAHLVARNIERLRDFRGMSAEVFVARVGAVTHELRAGLAGVAPMPIDLLWKIARVLEVPFGTLVQPTADTLTDPIRRKPGSKSSF